MSDGRVTENAYGKRRTTLPRRRRTKPKLSPASAPAVARATTWTTAVPPVASVNGGASTVAPFDATWGWISAVQAPAPSPASETATEIARLAAPAFTSR